MYCLMAYVKSNNVVLIEAAMRRIFIETGMTQEWGVLAKGDIIIARKDE